jgi:hypothetical protein
VTAPNESRRTYSASYGRHQDCKSLSASRLTFGCKNFAGNFVDLLPLVVTAISNWAGRMTASG